MRARAALLGGALIVAGCGGARHRKVAGPPPEYELPPPAWESTPTGARDGAADVAEPADGGPR